MTNVGPAHPACAREAVRLALKSFVDAHEQRDPKGYCVAELARAVISRVLQAARNELAEMQGAVDTWKMPDFADACCLARARLDFAIDRVNGVRQPGVGGRPRKVAANPPR
mgnify:CR=1 FL=1